MKTFRVLAVVALALFLVGCAKEQAQTEGVQVTTLSAPAIPPGASVINAGSCEGKNIRVILISAHYGGMITGPVKKETAVGTALEKIVNSGEYNILAIKTIYDEGFLVRAEVYFCSP